MSEPAPDRPVSRRSVLLGGAAAVGAAATGGGIAGAQSLPGAGSPIPTANPFTLGVASGDPFPDGMVLWTRLATHPLADDGRGGMPDRAVPVQWELATDEKFRDVVRRGEVDAKPSAAHSVHIEPSGLQPGREYFYRFRAGKNLSPTGRTRTAPAPGTMPDLTMCFTSCARFGHGYFTAYRRMAEDEPDLMLHLGDYIYEYGHKENDVRQVAGPEARTLAGYRQRHAQHKHDPDLQAAHLVAPWIAVWDDHEVENNWADGTPEQPDPNFQQRRAAAFRAYYENMPMRHAQAPHGPNLQLYRRLAWGDLATFHMLDTRQYRDDQTCEDKKADCDERFDPDRSITGAKQEQWIIDGFHRSTARWDVLGQQVFFSQIDLTPGKERGYNMDAWDGYVANRDRIAGAMTNSAVRNGVVLTGDVHKHWAAEIKGSHDDPDSRSAGTEFVTTSVTSGKDGDGESQDKVLQENPHVKFNIDRRGYIRTRFTTDELRADHRVVQQVSERGAKATTAASFTVTDRDPHLHRT